MIKRLRRKFILIAMLSVTIVLGSIIAIINIVNYCKIDADSEKVLSILIEYEGRFPMAEPFPSYSNEATEQKSLRDMSPETPFETRFFTVTAMQDGSLITDTGKIAAVSESQAIEIAQKLIQKGKTSGMYGNYKYRATVTNGNTMYVFLDCSKVLETFRSFLLYSLLISVIGLILVFILVIVLSRFALKPVEESYRKQKSFITNASHDIKTPLTIIKAEAEVIEITNGESEWTNDIKKQVERLTSLTEKLVFLSRMEENDYKLSFCEFSLSDMLEETCLSYEATTRVRGLDFTLDIQPDLKLIGNEDALRRATALIMDNAVKYSKSFINVRLTQSGNAKEIRFINDADGLKQGSLNEFFDRFYRADQSRNSRTGGHGIGLSVVKSVITAHKGKITAHSPDGKTAEFVITI